MGEIRVTEGPAVGRRAGARDARDGGDVSKAETARLEELDTATGEIDAGEADTAELAPVVGMLVGLGVSVLIWVVGGGLIWMAFRG